VSGQQPSVGCVVHFHDEGGPYAAIITALNENGTVELMTMGRNSIYFQHGVSMGGPDGTVPTKGCWTWPPFVPAKKAAE
jgi:hypothetical protein